MIRVVDSGQRAGSAAGHVATGHTVAYRSIAAEHVTRGAPDKPIRWRVGEPR